MYALDYSLDNLSMMALTLSVGFVVDDAIVMLENIVRHMEKGTPPMEAAFTGAREVGFTIPRWTLSLAAVFIPVLFMAESSGACSTNSAVTIGASILVSGVVSLTLTPICAVASCSPARGAPRKFYEASERVYERVLHGYEHSLAWVMERRPAALGFSVLILAATGRALRRGAKGFLPSEDNSQIFGNHGDGAGHVVRRPRATSAAGDGGAPAGSQRDATCPSWVAARSTRGACLCSSSRAPSAP